MLGFFLSHVLVPVCKSFAIKASTVACASWFLSEPKMPESLIKMD